METIKVLFVTPEAVPFAKTGGLADVSGSLPGALKQRGLDVRMILPQYRSIREGNFETRPVVQGLKVFLGKESIPVNVRETKTAEGFPVYLIEREDMYDRSGLYGNAQGDYYDNLERFSLLSHAALSFAENTDFRPDIIHGHDWQTGLVPALLKGPQAGNPAFKGTSSVFTIHNMGYQGIFPGEKLPVTGLPSPKFFHPGGLEYWGSISLLKSGIVYADAVTTVSPTYAREIQTAEYGMGMEGILQERSPFLHGILNGIDYSLWDPSKDPHISSHYSPETLDRKALCKKALLEETGLNKTLTKRPLLGMISRLDAQKGFDLLMETLDGILSLDVGLIILGSGDKKIQEALARAVERHSGRLGLSIGFNDSLAHRIISAADIFLIPSRYEPCGLTQMYALKYGAVPLVRATGGLNDTVVPFNPKTAKGNGFKFGPYKAEAFLATVKAAVRMFKDTKAWKVLRLNGMKADFSWDRSASGYVEIYQSLLKKTDKATKR